MVFEDDQSCFWILVDPLVTQVGSSLFKAVQHPHSSLIGLYIAAFEHFFDQDHIQGQQQAGALADPAAHSGHGDFYSQPPEAPKLPVQWQVIYVFVEQDLSQQAGTGDPLVDRT